MDGDLVQTQYLVQGIDELDVRYGFEGTCRVWRCHQSQLFPGDEISVDVGQKLTVLHEFLLILVVKRFLFGTNNGRKKGTMRPKQVQICKELAERVESLTETSRRPPQVGHLGVPRC